MADAKQATSAVSIASRMDDEASNGGPPEPRENMIATAVRFLQNPKVRESPVPQRKLFLSKKGLTDKEIELAIERSDTAGDATAVVAAPPTNQSVPPIAHAPVPVTSTWTRFRDYSASAIVVGGVSFGVYTLVKKYLMPMMVGPSEQDKQRAALQASIKELEESIQTVVTSLQDIQKSMRAQQDSMNQVVFNSAASRGPMEMEKMQVTEIKGEIQSLKGLLLSRNQFPPTPKTTPVIPAWQLGGSATPTSAGPTTPNGPKVTTFATSDAPSQPTRTLPGTLDTDDQNQSSSPSDVNDLPPPNQSEKSCCQKENADAIVTSQEAIGDDEQSSLTEDKLQMKSEVVEEDTTDKNNTMNGDASPTPLLAYES